MKKIDRTDPMNLVLLGIAAMSITAFGWSQFVAAGASPLLLLGFVFFGFVLALFGTGVILMGESERKPS